MIRGEVLLSDLDCSQIQYICLIVLALKYLGNKKNVMKKLVEVIAEDQMVNNSV